MRAQHETMPRQSWVPWEWQHRVCTCYDPRYHKEADGYVGFVCKDCGKYFRWVLILCRGCGKHYLALFAHPEFCPHTARCLDCIKAGYVNTCERGCSKREFRDYVYDEDRAPRVLPSMEDVLNLEITFDF